MQSVIDFEVLFEHAPNCYVLLTPELTIVAANAAYRQITASSPADLIGKNFLEVFPNDPTDPNNASSQRLRASLQRVAATGKPDALALIRYRVPKSTSQGTVLEERDWSATHTPIFHKNSNRIQFILQHTVDVSALRQRHAELMEDDSPEDSSSVSPTARADLLQRAQAVEDLNLLLNEERLQLRQLFEQAPGFIALLTGPDHVFQLTNDAYNQIVGHRDLIGKPLREAIPELEEQGIFDLFDRIYATGEAFTAQAMCISVQLTEGAELEDKYFNLVYQPMRAADGSITGIFVQGHDVTAEVEIQAALKQHQAQLEQTVRERSQALEESEIERERALYLSQHDSLTGLPNREKFHQELQRRVDLAQATRSAVGVLMIDLDQFKEINDSMGHFVGDVLLQEVAKRLRECAGTSAMVARLGGDEFAVICDGKLPADALAARLVFVLSRPYTFEDRHINTSVSIGLTFYPDDAVTPKQLLMNADMAMYRAKRKGRSTYMRYTPDLDLKAKRRQAIKDALRQALANDELELCYQPLISLQTGAITSAEALLRSYIYDIPLLSASELIAVAEDSGLIQDLGAWILHTACTQARRWQLSCDRPIPVAVNISPLQLRHDGFLELIDQTLAATGLDAHLLELEITERVLVEHSQQNLSTLQALRDRGIRISVDDFGTGFSSLGYLKAFPVDKLKIDQIFVKGLPDDHRDTAITSAIVNMAHGLDLEVIAEGIEHDSQRDFLARTGCDTGQGFLFSHALSATDLIAMLCGPVSSVSSG